MIQPEILSHWSTLVEGMQHSSKAFYAAMEQQLVARELPKVTTARERHSQGAVFGGKREYLKVRYGDLVSYICAAPYGTGFFFSNWLVLYPGCLGQLAAIPYLGWPLRLLVTRPTLYRKDVETMFQTAVHNALQDAIDDATSVAGIRALSERERTPDTRIIWDR